MQSAGQSRQELGFLTHPLQGALETAQRIHEGKQAENSSSW